jgi:RND family efflux transporter MFP subunit
MNKIGIAMITIVAFINGCGNVSKNAVEPGDHEEAIQFTLFTGEFEFYIEHEPLEPGEESEFLIHVTHLDTYQPLLAGTLVVKMGRVEVRSGHPDRPGIFVVSLTPDDAGEVDVLYTLQSGEIMSEVSHPAEVHPTDTGHTDVEHQEETETGEVIFLKEMAWKNDFMVKPVLTQPFSSVLRASGEILAVPGEKNNVAATSSGMIVFADRNLVQGSRVSKGHHLFTITASAVGSNNFGLLYQEYLNNLNKSRSEYTRHKKLYESHVIPERQYMESRTAYISDSLRYYDLAGKATEDGVMVNAPAEGFIHHLNVSEGQYVETGHLLVTLSSDRKLLLRADIPQQNYKQLKQTVNANFRPAFTDRVYTVDELNGRLLARGSSVAENDHYIPLYFEVQNDGTLLEGAYAEFYLMTGKKEGCLLLPETAILEEQGNHYVYVQVTGESFTKRIIETGEGDGIRTEVIRGLDPGERVVTRGVMLLKSTSMVTGDPGHGHSH